MTVVGRESVARLEVTGLGNATLTPFEALIYIGLEDDAAWVTEQERQVRAALGAPAGRIESAQVGALSQSLADLEHAIHPRLTFTTADNTPAALGALDSATLRSALFHAPCGRLHLPAPSADAAQELVTALAAHGFTLIDVAGADAAPALKTQTAIAALRTRIRTQLDPDARFALGARWAAGR